MAHIVFSPMISRDAVTAMGNDARQQSLEHVEVSAAFAQRKVNGWLLWELGERVNAGEPEFWR